MLKQIGVMLVLVGLAQFAQAKDKGDDVKHHHHHKWEYDSIQGLYSKQNCPGQYIEWLYQDDGTKVFLGCWGHKGK